jgi:hypothetical protein
MTANKTPQRRYAVIVSCVTLVALAGAGTWWYAKEHRTAINPPQQDQVASAEQFKVETLPLRVMPKPFRCVDVYDSVGVCCYVDGGFDRIGLSDGQMLSHHETDGLGLIRSGSPADVRVLDADNVLVAFENGIGRYCVSDPQRNRALLVAKPDRITLLDRGNKIGFLDMIGGLHLIPKEDLEKTIGGGPVYIHRRVPLFMLGDLSTDFVAIGDIDARVTWLTADSGRVQGAIDCEGPFVEYEMQAAFDQELVIATLDQVYLLDVRMGRSRKLYTPRERVCGLYHSHMEQATLIADIDDSNRLMISFVDHRVGLLRQSDKIELEDRPLRARFARDAGMGIVWLALSFGNQKLGTVRILIRP